MTPSFQFGVSEFTTWPWTFEQDVEHYAQLGVDAIEVCEFKLDPDRAGDQLALVRAHGLPISSVQPRVHSPFPNQLRTEPATPPERMALFRQSITRFGEAAPGTTLVTITGAAPKGNFRDAFDVVVREYRELARFAAGHGVRIALEPLHPVLMNLDSFVWSLPGALRLAEAVDQPNFGIWVDLWHIWQDPAAPAHLAACGDRIFGVHVSDWHTPRSFLDRGVVGRGEIPLPPLLRALRQCGYTGPYTAEIFSEETLPDSLWKTNLDQLVRDNRQGFSDAWAQATEDQAP